MKPIELSNVIDLDLGRAPEESGRVPNPLAVAPNRFIQQRPGRIIAVGGGKGGIGKTLVSAGLGCALARLGHKVLLVDADLGGASLHTALGIAQPARTLADFVHRRVMRLEDVVIPTGIERLALIAGSQDVLDAANPKYQQKVKLLRALQGLNVDYLILDLGAGTSFSVLDFFLIADHGLLVALPEPTSVENAYRFLKSAFFRRLQYLEEQHGVDDWVEEALSGQEGTSRTPFQLVEQIKKQYPEVGARLEQELKTFRAKLVVNQARSPADTQVGSGMVSAWKKIFGLEMDFLGAIPYDDEAWRAVRKRRPVVVERPDSEASRGLFAVTENLMSLDAQPSSAVFRVHP